MSAESRHLIFVSSVEVIQDLGLNQWPASKTCLDTIPLPLPMLNRQWRFMYSPNKVEMLEVTEGW